MSRNTYLSSTTTRLKITTTVSTRGRCVRAEASIPMLSLENLRLGVEGPEWEESLSSVADMDTRGERRPLRGVSSSSSESLAPPYGGRICYKK